MNPETVVFTDIYPAWELPWYQTPIGLLVLVALALLVFMLGLIFWVWRRPYRKMAKLATLIVRDVHNAPDHCASYIKIVCALHKIPVHTQITEHEQIALLKKRFAHSDWDFLQETLIRARYGREEAPLETRKRWVAFLQKSVRGLRD